MVPKIDQEWLIDWKIQKSVGLELFVMSKVPKNYTVPVYKLEMVTGYRMNVNEKFIRTYKQRLPY